VIIADTGAVLALLNRNDRQHEAVRKIYERDPDEWVLPWVILPEVDYLVAGELGARAEEIFFADLAGAAFNVEYGMDRDLVRASRSTRSTGRCAWALWILS